MELQNDWTSFFKEKKVLSLKTCPRPRSPDASRAGVTGRGKLQTQPHGSLSGTRYSGSRMTRVPAIPAPCRTSCWGVRLQRGKNVPRSSCPWNSSAADVSPLAWVFLRYSLCKHGSNGFKAPWETCHLSVAPVYTQSDPTGDPLTSVRNIYVTAASPVSASEQPICESSREQSSWISGTDTKGRVIVNVPRLFPLHNEGKLQPLPVLGWIHVVSLSSLVPLLFLFLLLLLLYSWIGPSLSSFHLHDYSLQLAQREQLDSAAKKKKAHFYGLVNELHLALLAAKSWRGVEWFVCRGSLLSHVRRPENKEASRVSSEQLGNQFVEL